MYSKIPLNICCNTNFPFIEDTYDSLTTYKRICKLAGVIDKIQDYLVTLNFDKYKEYVDTQVTNLKLYVDEENKKVYDYCDLQLENAKNYTDDELAKLNLELINYINQKIQYLKTYIDNNDLILKNYIDEEIKKLEKEIEEISTKGIEVYNPTTGKYDYLQNTLNDMYYYLRYYGIKAIEFDTLGLTTKTFDDKLITAREFDLYSKQLLMIDWSCNMYSPFDGQIKPISTIVNELATLHKQEITVGEFDALNITAQDFDNKNLTAYQFDWEGKTLLTA